ncbi:Pre-mRNA-splicing factor 38 [Pseudozyma hubeiensis]|nr:Pre-mRNA-splicing factor 38 [Pseudozyma hubeiensis]
MANATIRNAHSIHGTNPQHLIEKPIRYRIYSSPYWKQHCFALSASTILPLATSLHHIGGLIGGLQRPSHFLCLLQKLLQIQPDPSIIDAYLSAGDFKYLRALTAFYIRLTYDSKSVYEKLEPMLEDARKLRWCRADGGYEVVCVDEWVDMLLREERVCDIILPRLVRREVCEVRDGLMPRISVLETKLLKAIRGEEESEEEEEDDLKDVRRWKLQRLRELKRIQPAKVVRKPVYDDVREYDSQEDSDAQQSGRRRFVSPTPSVSPDRQLAADVDRDRSRSPDSGGWVSRSPSRSPDREGYVSRSPSRSPDRELGEAEEEGYISRSPSRSPDRI